MNKRIILSIMGIILLVVLGIIVKLFIIGTKDYSFVEITSIGNTNNQILIKGKITKENYKYKKYSYMLVGKELYITINSVKTINKQENNAFTIEMPISINNVDHIQLTDDKTTKVIYK